MKKRSNVPIEKILLAIVGAAGLIAVVAVAPGIGPALRMFGFGKRDYSKKYLSNTFTRMKQKGYIVFEGEGRQRRVRLTKKGEQRLESYANKDIVLERPDTWDGKWRVVIFDIAEKRRFVRDKLRTELHNIGFKKLQQSVWVFPYECEEFIKLLKADQRIGKNLVYMVVERLEYPKDVRAMFGL